MGAATRGRLLPARGASAARPVELGSHPCGRGAQAAGLRGARHPRFLPRARHEGRHAWRPPPRTRQHWTNATFRSLPRADGATWLDLRDVRAAWSGTAAVGNRGRFRSRPDPSVRRNGRIQRPVRAGSFLRVPGCGVERADPFAPPSSTACACSVTAARLFAVRLDRDVYGTAPSLLSETEPAMITSSPCCRSPRRHPVLGVQLQRVITRKTSSKLRPVVIG